MVLYFIVRYEVESLYLEHQVCKDPKRLPQVTNVEQTPSLYLYTTVGTISTTKTHSKI